MKKTFIISAIVLAMLLISSIPLSVNAHPGRTDSQGGHTDHSTGEYHYHHGYPAHDHYDMDGDGDLDCPYNFDNQTRNNSTTGTNSANRTPITATTTTTPATAPITNKEEAEVPNWVYWVFAAQFFVALVLYISNRDQKRNIERMVRKHERDLADMSNSCARNLAEKNATDKELQQARSSVEQIKKERSELLNSLNSERMELAKVKQIRYRMKNAPLDVTFTSDGSPIYWKPNMMKPYGDYTVYVNEKNNIYHVDRLCASYRASESHIFHVIGHKRPCKKCAEGFFDFTAVPDWYVSMEDVVQTSIFDNS